ncbi:MAG: DinB family protein [bacterium]
MTRRTDALAERLEQGVHQLTDLARSMTEEQWQTRVPHDGRKVGVVVHHVATMYPIEIELAVKLAGGQAVEGVTWQAVHLMNAAHAGDYDGVTKGEALALLMRNSMAAAAAVRALTDEQLDMVAPLSLENDGPRSAQYMLEGHAVGHAWHHLIGIRKALG